MNRIAIAIALATLTLLLAASRATAVELPQKVDKKVTLELREADVKNVYKLFADFMGIPVRVDACLDGRTVDIKLKNAPMSLVLDVMGAKLTASHTMQPDGVLLVACRDGDGVTPPAAAPVAPNGGPDKRITLDVKDADLARVAGLLAQVAGAKLKPLTSLNGKVTMSVKNVRVATAMQVLRESLDLESLDLVDGELVIAERNAAPTP